jgi:hypothetical protein
MGETHAIAPSAKAAKIVPGKPPSPLRLTKRPFFVAIISHPLLRVLVARA